MFGAERGRAALIAAAIAGLVGPLVLSAVPPALAQDAVDTIVTGAIDPDDVASPTAEGSPEFRDALTLVADGDYASGFALADALPDPVERRTVQWLAIYYGNGDISFADIERFSNEAPGFVNPSTFQTRIEQSILRLKPENATTIVFLTGVELNTVEAQLLLAQTYVAAGEPENATQVVRALWATEYLDASLEKRVLASFSSLIDRDTHWARAVHLMMNDRAQGSERLLPYLSDAQKSLVVARAAVSRKSSKAKGLLDAVDPAYQTHPVFYYSRAQRARQAGLLEDALDWLNKAHGELPDAAEWWYERRALIREMLSEGKAALAYHAADTYREGPEGRLVEARFHAGWIALSFLGDAKAARWHFETMASLSTLADSVTQANFWLGRSLLMLGEVAEARAAFERAAEHGTVYYGLLARAELGMSGAEVRPSPEWEATRPDFENLELVRAIRLLAANGEGTRAIPLLRLLADGLTNGPFLLQAARLAQELGAHSVAISIADIAERRGFPLDAYNFPHDGIPDGTKLADVDEAAVYAVTRQESRFQIDAISSAGARGLMQLMPGTAQEVAANVGVEYSKSRLITDGAYNALLGSTYLAKQLRYYEGSLLLAAAAYNAGPGNANKWIKAFGDPRASNVDPVVWVELIPLQETRKYVQRVLGNYMIYKARLGPVEMTLKDALRRIPL